MSKFKIGDRVRINAEAGPVLAGLAGEITNTRETGFEHLVRLDTGDTWGFDTHELEPGFKIGDRVRTHTPESPGGTFDGLVGTIIRDCGAPGYDWTVTLESPDLVTGNEIVFKGEELELLALGDEIEPLADWERELLFEKEDLGSVYEAVATRLGFFPLRWGY